MRNLIKLTLAVVFTCSISPAFALTSNGIDGALVANTSLTLTATNNQTFNYTTINLGAGSTLDFSGISSGDSVFILGTGDFKLDGIINLPSSTSFTFETTGGIYLDGSILTSHSNLSFISQSLYLGSNSIITDAGGNISIDAGYGSVTTNGKIDLGAPPPQDVSIGNGGGIALNPSPLTLVPEPTSYAMMALGLLVMTYRARRFYS